LDISRAAFAGLPAVNFDCQVPTNIFNKALEDVSGRILAPMSERQVMAAKNSVVLPTGRKG
jgi:hypothetical protein